MELTAEEAEQYDRQIRLWGLEAQKRLRASAVLVVGGGGLGAELCKNIVLAGVKSVTLLDHTSLSSLDLGNRFLASSNGENRAKQALDNLKALNPNVTVTVDTEAVEEKQDTFFTQFNTVVHHIKFFCGDVWGFYGYFFSDLGIHDYSVEVVMETSIEEDGEVVKKVHSDKKTMKKTCSFPPLQEAVEMCWASKPARYFKRTPPTWFIIQCLQEFRDSNNGRDPESEEDKEQLLTACEVTLSKLGVTSDLIPNYFYRFCFCDLSPVCAIVGGVLGQEVIKALSGKDEPYKNCFLYDGVNSTGIVEFIGH